MSLLHASDAVEFRVELKDSADAPPQRIVIYDWFVHEDNGAPPRGGNRVEVLVDGEAAWDRVAGDLSGATHDVQIATWMCRPDIELRRPQELALSQPADRCHLRLGAILEKLAAKGTRIRLLIWGMAYTPITNRWLRRWHWRGRDNIDVLEQDHRNIIGSFHQKTMTIDGRVGYCGGMNMKENDWDVTRHHLYDVRRYGHKDQPWQRMPAKLRKKFPRFAPRHDLMARIEGPCVGDMLDNFWGRWQKVRKARRESINTRFIDYIRRKFGSDPSPDFDKPDGGLKPAGDHWAQIVRTTPNGKKNILAAYERAIRNARRYIYIENQYFRSPEIGRMLRETLEANERLRLIVVALPCNDGKGRWYDPAAYYTAQTLKEIRKTREDFMLNRIIVHDYDARDRLKYRDVDVHAKMMIVDDAWVTVGSANIHDRGMKTEGEINLVVLDKEIAGDLRRRLMAEHLEIATDDPRLEDVDEAFDLWERHANENVRLKAQGQEPRSRVHHFIQKGARWKPFWIGVGTF